MKTIKAGLLAIIPLLIVVGLFVGQAMSDAKSTHDYSNISLSIVTTGDTARVVKITPALAIMGFTYKDSIDYQADTSAHQTISWTSPMQIFTWAPVADTQGTYKCSIAFQAQTLGFDLVMNEKDTTLATLIDTLVYLYNNTTNMKDTVLAEDSVTYIKLVSKIGEGVLKGPWSQIFVITGGSAAIGDTASAVDSVTIAMVCDSMVTATNDDAGVDSFMTAYDSTTFYIVQSDDPGVLFHDTIDSDMHVDTHAVWAESQANITSWSRKLDTIPLKPAVVTTPYGPNYRGFDGFFKVLASEATGQGVGEKDSVYLQLWSAKKKGGATEYTVLAGDTCAACPCSLEYTVPPDTARGAIILGEKLFIWVQIADSASDSTFSILYPFRQDYILYEAP